MSKNPTKSDQKESRSILIVKSGYLFIGINFILGIFNAIVGLLSGSIAITSDAVHSIIDSISGFLVVISEKLASHHKFSEHRARIERITTILIALIIIATGIHIFIESIEKIIEPEAPDYSAPTIIVVIASIALKYLLAYYLRQTGRKVKSSVLTAYAAETLNDTWISVAVLASAIIYIIWHVDIEAYVSIIISVIIIKIGLEFIFPNLSHHHHHPLETDSTHGVHHKS